MLLIGLLGLASQAVRADEADWPCAQRLVPVLEAGSYWNGAVPAHTAWRDDEALFAVVPEVVDRDVSDSDASAKLAAYAASVPAARMPAVFSAIVDQTNDQRSRLIEQLEKLGRRQQGMGRTVAALSNRIDAMGATDASRADVTGERDFDMQAFQQTQSTIRYACEAPANMERRLGVLARVLAKRAKQP